jgi:hypothetical protein
MRPTRSQFLRPCAHREKIALDHIWLEQLYPHRDRPGATACDRMLL